MTRDRLTEDWHGRYWWHQTGHRRPEGWMHGTYTAMCTDPLCCWTVVVERRPDGWWWDHDNLEGDHQSGGPHEHWQQAAHAAVLAGIARPRQ